MTYTIMKSATDDFTVIYCVGLDGEPITNATHASVSYTHLTLPTTD